MSEEKEKLLTIEERAILVQIAAAEPPESQRAQALLAAADGATLEQAAVQANLTPNQVKYWLGRFRSGRLSVFPQELVTAVAEMETPLKPASAVTIADVPLEKEPEEKKSKSKKKKKSKKEEKVKKKSKSKKKDKSKSKKKATEERKAGKKSKKKKDSKKSGGKNEKGKKNIKEEKSKKTKSKKKKAKKKK